MNSEVNGAEYLRRLKDDLQPQANPLTDTSPGSSKSALERRSVPRYKCMGSAQVREQNSDVYTWASITDISLHGCYLEMAAVFPVGTTVLLQIEVAHHRLILKGEVRVTYPYLGMGIAFREITAQDRTQLLDIVHMVASEMRLVVPQPEPKEVLPPMPEVSEPERALELMRGFFHTRKVMTRDEFSNILGALSAKV